MKGTTDIQQAFRWLMADSRNELSVFETPLGFQLFIIRKKDNQAYAKWREKNIVELSMRYSNFCQDGNTDMTMDEFAQSEYLRHMN